MKKSSQPPVFTIEGTSFLVDIDKQVLRQTNNPANEISFSGDMTDLGTHYTFCYDLHRKNVYDKSNGIYESEDWTPVTVPKLIDLAPYGMAEKYGLTIKQLQGKTDFEVIVDQEALAIRQQGVLPKIDIAGESFIIDLRLHELRHAQNFHPVLSLQSFELSSDGWKYEAFYHPVMKQVVEIDPKLTGFPDGVIQIRIPNEIGLDPIATAKEYGMNERELLRRYPIQKELKAEIIPLAETDIPALIRRNREELRREHEEITRRLKPRIRPKF